MLPIPLPPPPPHRDPDPSGVKDVLQILNEPLQYHFNQCRIFFYLAAFKDLWFRAPNLE